MRFREKLNLLAVLGAMMMVVLDAGMLNVALPTLSIALGVDVAHGIWAISAYQIALLVGLLPSAQLADRFGQRRIIILGIALYLAASIGCAASTGLATLVAARFVQGLGGAVIMALGISLLRVSFGTERLGAVIAWNAMVVAMSSAAAPSVAAAILSLASWPWLFLAKIPLGLVVAAAATTFPQDPPKRTAVDGGLIFLHALIAVLLMLAVTRLLTDTSLAFGLLAVGTLLAGLLIVRQANDPAPLWAIDLFAAPVFRISMLASVLCFIGQTAGLVGLPILLQAGRESGLLATASIMTCWPIAAAVTAAVSGRLADRLGSPVLCSFGAALLATSLVACASATAAENAMFYVLIAIVGGAGFGMFQVPNNRSLFLSASIDRAAAAGGMQGTARLLGQTLGALLVGLFLNRYPGPEAAQFAIGLGGLFAAAAALVSLTPFLRFVQRRHA